MAKRCFLAEINYAFTLYISNKKYRYKEANTETCYFYYGNNYKIINNFVKL